MTNNNDEAPATERRPNEPTETRTQAVVRVIGAIEEILEGVGVTRIDEPFFMEPDAAHRLVAEGPRFELAIKERKLRPEEVLEEGTPHPGGARPGKRATPKPETEE